MYNVDPKAYFSKICSETKFKNIKPVLSLNLRREVAESLIKIIQTPDLVT